MTKNKEPLHLILILSEQKNGFDKRKKLALNIGISEWKFSRSTIRIWVSARRSDDNANYTQTLIECVAFFDCGVNFESKFLPLCDNFFFGTCSFCNLFLFLICPFAMNVCCFKNVLFFISFLFCFTKTICLFIVIVFFYLLFCVVLLLSKCDVEREWAFV